FNHNQPDLQPSPTRRSAELPMAEVLAPTIRYAREGHPVHEVIAHYWARSVPVLAEWPGFSEQFTIDGRAPATGETWRNPNLANRSEEHTSELQSRENLVCRL